MPRNRAAEAVAQARLGRPRLGELAPDEHAAQVARALSPSARSSALADVDLEAELPGPPAYAGDE